MSMEPLPVTPEQMRALAHPARLAMLEHLGYRGEMTATQLAELVDESPSNCSWHLRKLAQVGLVERAEGFNERDRPWRITFHSHEFVDGWQQGGLASVLVHRQADRMLRATADQAARPSHSGSNGTWLTDDEARALIARLSQLEEMVPDAEQRRRDPSARPAGARLYEFVGWLAPVDLES